MRYLLDTRPSAKSDSDVKRSLKVLMYSKYTALFRARKGEIMSLSWAEVDLDKGCIILSVMQNNERRSLPLRGLALKLM